MTESLYILTGASRGLGAALAEQLVQQAGTTLLGLSRTPHPKLDALARAAGTRCEQWPVDLADPLAAAARLGVWLTAQDGAHFASATLINNAAALPRIALLEASDATELSRVVRVGLEAPLLLTAGFLRATRGWAATRKVLNISSGLGRQPMAAQVAYCAVKAGLDHATRALALEGGARVVSIAPGVIDTDMQTALRPPAGGRRARRVRGRPHDIALSRTAATEKAKPPANRRRAGGAVGRINAKAAGAKRPHGAQAWCGQAAGESDPADVQP